MIGYTNFCCFWFRLNFAYKFEEEPHLGIVIFAEKIFKKIVISFPEKVHCYISLFYIYNFVFFVFDLRYAWKHSYLFTKEFFTSLFIQHLRIGFFESCLGVNISSGASVDISLNLRKASSVEKYFSMPVCVIFKDFVSSYYDTTAICYGSFNSIWLAFKICKNYVNGCFCKCRISRCFIWCWDKIIAQLRESFDKLSCYCRPSSEILIEIPTIYVVRVL